MDEGIIIYYGEGKGKSSAALGYAIKRVSDGGVAYIVRFLKEQVSSGYIERLEPEFKMFRFERSSAGYADMTEKEREEERINIKNGIAFAKKVMATGECDLLVLDEVLGAVDEGIIKEEELLEALTMRSSDTTVILTGRNLPDKIRLMSHKVYNITVEK